MQKNERPVQSFAFMCVPISSGFLSTCSVDFAIEDAANIARNTNTEVNTVIKANVAAATTQLRDSMVGRRQTLIISSDKNSVIDFQYWQSL